MTNNRKKAISCIILIVFSFVILSSSCFIITHTNHDCTGDNCSICMELAKCHKTLNTFDTVAVGGEHLSIMMFALVLTLKSFTKTRLDHTTLISLKVEFLN